MYDGPIIDAHIHQWDPRVTPRTVSPVLKTLGWNRSLMVGLATRAFPQAQLDFIGDPEIALNPFLPGMWRAGTRGRDVRGFVHVQADWKTSAPMGVVDETTWLEEICGSDLLAVVGRADLASPSLDAILDGHERESHRFRGIRDYLTNGHGNEGIASFSPVPDKATDPAWRRGFDRLGERGLSFDAWCYGHQLGALETLAASHPGTRMVLDHLGSPIGIGGPYAGLGATPAEREQIIGKWSDDMAALAEHPHVAVKLSGLAMTVSGFAWHRRADPVTAEEVAESFAPLVTHALDLFGPGRCMIASNFPMDKVSLDYKTLYDAWDLLTEDLSVDAQRAVFHDTAAEFYRIPNEANRRP